MPWLPKVERDNGQRPSISCCRYLGRYRTTTTNYLNGFVLERLSEEENRLNCTGADR